jgi:hypothetical protein
VRELQHQQGRRERRDRGVPCDPDLVELVVLTTAHLDRLTPVARALRDSVAASHVRILDLVGIETGAGDGFATVELEDLPGLAELGEVDGEVGGLLSEDDLALASRALPPGTSALLLVVEHVWAGPLAHAARAAGGRLVGGERIPRHRLEQTRRSRSPRRAAGG